MNYLQTYDGASDFAKSTRYKYESSTPYFGFLFCKFRNSIIAGWRQRPWTSDVPSK